MANTLTFNAKMSVFHPESTVRDAVTFTVPSVAASDSNVIAATAEFTGTGSNTMLVGASGLLTAGGSNQVDPITGTLLDFDDYWALGIVVGRAASANDPTGSLTITSNGFGGFSTNGTNITASENFSLFIRHAVERTATTGETLTINLTGTTGYKVSVLAVGQTD